MQVLDVALTFDGFFAPIANTAHSGSTSPHCDASQAKMSVANAMASDIYQ
jgi:hypothetical protein